MLTMSQKSFLYTWNSSSCFQ